MVRRIQKVFTTSQQEYDTVTLTLHLNNEKHNTIHDLRLSHPDKDVLLLMGMKLDDVVDIRDALDNCIENW
ncbi:MAG: hypothetical protein PHC28_04830 [Flavobacterium sp.]|uniref:hypothetical protein n=1 Tax=Flavobacterium sp. TaxID=239 RepID=UPI002610E7FE|nr:hypothetical protein [Flavobacterium sp.]MDD5149790.1 hypothetical protein [Flavobacterium sp.]